MKIILLATILLFLTSCCVCPEPTIERHTTTTINNSTPTAPDEQPHEDNSTPPAEEEATPITPTTNNFHFIYHDTGSSNNNNEYYYNGDKIKIVLSKQITNNRGEPFIEMYINNNVSQVCTKSGHCTTYGEYEPYMVQSPADYTLTTQPVKKKRYKGISVYEYVEDGQTLLIREYGGLLLRRGNIEYRELSLNNVKGSDVTP